MADFYSLPDEDAFTAIGQSQEDFLLYDPADKEWLIQPEELIPPMQNAWPGNQQIQFSSVLDADPFVQEQNLFQNGPISAVENGMLKPSAQKTVEEPRSMAWTLPDTLESNLAGPSNAAQLGSEMPESAQHQQIHTSSSRVLVTPQIEITGSPAVTTEGTNLEHVCTYTGCDRRFDNLKSLRNHKKRCGAGKTPRHQCDTCKKLYWHPKDKIRCLNKHLKAKVNCPGCQKPYSRRDNMIRHLTSKHPDLPIPAVADSSPSIQGLTIRSVATPRTAASSSFQASGSVSGHEFAAPELGIYQLSASPVQANPAAMVRTISNTTSFMDLDSTFSVTESETPLTVPDSSFDICIDPSLLQDSVQPPSKWLGPLF